MKVEKSLLKSKMALHNLRDKDLADLLGISKASISRRFSGAIPFSAPEIATIKKVLKLTDKEISIIFLQ